MKPFVLATWTHEMHDPVASEERHEKLHDGIAGREKRTYRAIVRQLDEAFERLMKTLDDVQLSADATLSARRSAREPSAGVGYAST